MARVCSVCAHPEREAINAALVGGEPYRSVAQRFAASPDAVFRHKREHIAGLLGKAAQAKEAADITEAGSLLDQLRALRRRALGILAQAEAVKDLRTALLALREARGTLETEARIQGPVVRELPMTIPVYSFDPDVVFPDPKSPSDAPVALPTDPPLGRHANGSGT
jgi:transposase-like protein